MLRPNYDERRAAVIPIWQRRTDLPIVGQNGMEQQQQCVCAVVFTPLARPCEGGSHHKHDNHLWLLAQLPPAPVLDTLLSRKSALQAVLSRIQPTFSCDSPKTPHASLRATCKQSMSARSEKPRRAPSRDLYRDATVCDHTYDYGHACHECSHSKEVCGQWMAE